jgi:hypothetical protein
VSFRALFLSLAAMSEEPALTTKFYSLRPDRKRAPGNGMTGRLRGDAARRVTANPHALGFYRVVGFIECGIAETDFGAAPRMVLVLS